MGPRGKCEVYGFIKDIYRKLDENQILRCLTCMVSNYASGRKHAKNRYTFAVNLPDTIRCPKRQIATNKNKIFFLSSMCYLKQRNSSTKYNLRTVFLRFASD